MPSTSLRPAILAALLALVPAAGVAQVYTPPPPPVVHMPSLIWHNFMMNQIRSNALASSMFLESMLADMRTLGESIASSSGAGKTLDRVGSLPAAGAPGTFYPELAFEPSGYSLLAARMAEEDSTLDAGAMEALFNGLWQGYYASFREEHERLGMPLDDLGAALSAYIVLSYLYAHDLDGLEAEKTIAVYAQAAAILLGNEELAGMQDDDKELLAESFVTMGSMPALIFDQTRDPEQRRKAAMDNLERLFGSGAGELRITEAGIAR
ncbi:MAG: DUF6683 family protein [Rhodothermales bacterium]